VRYFVARKVMKSGGGVSAIQASLIAFGLHRPCTRIFNLNTYLVMKTGDNVLISPEVTHKSEWTQGTVIEVEANPFVGTVISAETPSGEIYFDKEYQFKPAY